MAGPMMTIHYHGTPLTPAAAILTLAGKCFCVSHARPDQVELVHRIGQSVMLDNGAFSKFTRGAEVSWDDYYEWTDRWLDYPTTWAVIPDEIAAGSQEQDALIREWPHGDRGAPVWHTGEPIDRLLRLVDEWPKVCVGSTDDHWQVLSSSWRERMDEAFNEIAKRHRHLPDGTEGTARMTRLPLLTLALSLVAGTALADPCAAKVTGYKAGQTVAGTVRYVGDGDGLCLSPSRDPTTWVEIRLADFMAPELSERNGRQARDTLRRLALGRQAVCTVRRGKNGRTSSYDRLIASCTVEGRSLAELLRSSGVKEGGR